MSVARSFAAFAAVGALGFVIEAALLTWLTLVAGWGAVPARGVSFPLAVTATWLLNRRFAFARHRTHASSAEYAGYFAIQVAGAFCNLAIYTACLKLWPFLAAWPIAALGAGAGFALVFNFLVTRATLYGRRRDAAQETA